MRAALLKKQEKILNMRYNVHKAWRNSLWLCLFCLLLAGMSGCEINRLNRAEDLYNVNNYPLAIKELDELIVVVKNGAYRTRAELIRGNCYLELGNIAAANQDIPLSIKFYKLANNENADIELGKTYLRLSQQAYRTELWGAISLNPLSLLRHPE